MGNENPLLALSINGQEHLLADAGALLLHLPAIQEAEFTEVWLWRGDETLSMLTNRERDKAFLLFLTDDNPTGFHAVSQNNAWVDEPVDFLLNNGQVDEWEASEIVSLSEGMRALERFSAHGGMAPFIVWHDDSQ